MSTGTEVWMTLHAIQRDLHAPKSQENKFGGYKYRSAEDILNAVKPLLAEHGASLRISDSIEEMGGRAYVKSTAMLRVNGEDAFTHAFAREPEDRKGMDASQITGAASSYARKYALNGLFAIDDTKDADATNDHSKSPPAATQRKQSASTPPKAKADPRAVVAKRIEADPEAKWFEVVAFAKGEHKDRPMGEIAMDGDHAALTALLDYIDPVALEHELAVKRLKAAIAEAKSNAEAEAKQGEQDTPNDEECPFNT